MLDLASVTRRRAAMQIALDRIDPVAAVDDAAQDAAVQALVTERFDAFGAGGLAPTLVWAVALAYGAPHARAVALVTVVLQAAAFALARVAVRRRVGGLRASHGALAFAIVLGLSMVTLFIAAAGVGELLGFTLFTLCTIAAVLFPWGWRMELMLVAAELGMLAAASVRLHFFLGSLELIPVVTIAAMLCIAIAEGHARSFRATLIRRRSEEAARRDLAASHDNYRDMTEHARDSIWAVDLEGRITYINEAGARFLGKTPAEVIGKNVDDHVTDHPLNPSPDAMRAILERDAALPPTVIQLRNDARRHWLEMVAYAVRDAAGTIVGFRGISRDVTARFEAEAALRASEARYRGLVESQEALIYRADLEGNLLFANEVCRRKYGVLDEPAHTLNFLTFVHPDDVPAARAAFAAVGRGGRYRRCSRGRTPEGWRWIEWEVCAIADAHGAIIEVQGVGHDVTEQREADEALQQSLTALREREEQLRLMGRQQVAIREAERKRLSFDLHDGVCQELVGIGILIESARRRGVSESANPTLTQAQSHLREVGEHLRLMARDLRPLQLPDLGLSECLRALATGMASDGVQVSVEFPTPIPRLDEELEVAVYRVAQEALANAVRHAGAHTVTVTLMAGEGMLRLEVRDDGRGFLRDELCAPALGLVAMEERAAALGGRLRVRSAPGTGTTITLECPLAAPSSSVAS